MNYDELTEAQREALKIRPRNTAVYESNTTLMDKTTGEILRHENKTVRKVSEEPDFIKVYYKTMLSFADAESIPLEFVLAISTYITWSNNGSQMRYKNDKPNREDVCNMLGIKEAMYKRYLKRCVECQLLFPSSYRGCYEVNPFFIAKGQWDSIRQLQMCLDFVSGKWVRLIPEDQATMLDPTTMPAELSDQGETEPGND